MGDPIALVDVINREQLLRFALEVHALSEEMSDDNPDSDVIKNVSDKAEEIITWYCMNELINKNGCFTEDEIVEKFQNLKTEFLVQRLVEKGFVEADFTQTTEDGCLPYMLTSLGKQAVNNLLPNDEKRIEDEHSRQCNS